MFEKLVVNGRDGKVKMPEPGAVVGWFSTWSLVRDKNQDTYRFTAKFEHVNALLWQQPYEKQITLQVSKDKTYQLCQEDGAKVVFDAENKSLVMEHVTLCLPGNSRQ